MCCTSRLKKQSTDRRILSMKGMNRVMEMKYRGDDYRRKLPGLKKQPQWNAHIAIPMAKGQYEDCTVCNAPKLPDLFLQFNGFHIFSGN